MKMTEEHYQQFKELISHRFTKESYDKYQQARLSQTRWLWDSAYGHDLATRQSVARWISDYLYPYLSDNHIETALKRIAKEVEAI